MNLKARRVSPWGPIASNNWPQRRPRLRPWLLPGWAQTCQKQKIKMRSRILKFACILLGPKMTVLREIFGWIPSLVLGAGDGDVDLMASWNTGWGEWDLDERLPPTTDLKGDLDLDRDRCLGEPEAAKNRKKREQKIKCVLWHWSFLASCQEQKREY